MSCGQEIIYQGVVTSKQSNAIIPYITVKLIKEKITISADEKGEFRLVSVNKMSDDSLLFSGVGYKSLKIAVSKFIISTKIELEEDGIFLNEVKVSSAKKKLKQKTLNPFDLGTRVLMNSDFWQMHQAAIKLSAPERFCTLKYIEISRLVNVYGGTNKKVHFRVHIYNIDPATGGPGDDIVHQVIEVFDEGHARIKVDLNDYHILIPDNVFFAGVEWLFIPQNENISRHLSEYHVGYLPVIYNTQSLHADKRLDTWIKPTADEPWFFNDPTEGRQVSNIAISATIEY
ncbi:MAG: hypothetical protein JWQ66_1819 [Mucilaginibacter sp.]|nr:hypothetical protein [Mucilaginibacter sp.]